MSSHHATDPWRSKLHKDGTATVWDVYLQQWVRYPRGIPDRISASMAPKERDRIHKHFARCGNSSGGYVLPPCYVKDSARP